MIYTYDNTRYEKLSSKYEELENELDYLNDYLVKLSGCSLSSKDNQTLNSILQQIGELKGITNHIYHILRMGRKLYKKDCSFSQDAKDELQEIWNEIDGVLKSTRTWMQEEKEGTETIINQKVHDLNRSFKKSKKNHIERLQRGECNAIAGMAFLDILSNCEQVLFNCTSMSEIN